MRLILLGAPGAGKGTQAEFICSKLNVPAISTGNIIREAIRTGTEMGKAAKSYTEKGALVPDEVVIGIIKERLAKPDCTDGFLLDGFPRTLPQAEALTEMGVDLDLALELDVPDEVIVGRMSGRRVCDKCSASYHVEFNPPSKEGQCDKCGGNLSVRKDDAPETVQERLRVYHEQTAPLVAYYRQRGILKTVKGMDTVEATTKLVLAAVES